MFAICLTDPPMGVALIELLPSMRSVIADSISAEVISIVGATVAVLSTEDVALPRAPKNATWGAIASFVMLDAWAVIKKRVKIGARIFATMFSLSRLR